MKIGIVTPIFPPQVGGAATYYNTLICEMVGHPKIQSIDVFTQRSPKDRNNKRHDSIIINKIFPNRQISGISMYKNLTLYFLQNCLYPYLLYLIYIKKLDLVIIHSSFFNQPNILNSLLRIFVLFGTNCKLVLDFRDRLLPRIPSGNFSWSSEKISCSMNVHNYLETEFALKSKLVPIPVDFADIPTSTVPRANFILYAGSIDNRKNVQLIIEAFQSSSELHSKYELILVGHIRNKEVLRKIHCKSIKVIGAASNMEVRSLMNDASLTINISPIEGMPRVSLEALWYCARVILPPDVPEFENHIPTAVFKGNTPQDLVDFIIARLQINDGLNYPFRDHYPSIVLSKLFRTVLRN